MAADRIDGRKLLLSHRFLALMLRVHGRRLRLPFRLW